MPPDADAAFWSAAVTRRQYAAFDAECACTKAMHAEYAQRHSSLQRVLLIDGSGFRWEGLGNSGVRWMGLLRYGYATGRATFLKLARECNPRGEGACRLDVGEYFTGWGGVDWHWGSQAAAVRRTLAAQKVRPLVVEYGCERRRAPGCALARLRLHNGSTLLLSEPAELVGWLRSEPRRWIRLVLAQQDSLEGSYSKPEALRTTLPLRACPAGAKPAPPDFRTRELALKCETFAFMQPRRPLRAALAPLLGRLEPFETIVGVHLRTGYADWAYRNDESYFGAVGAPKPAPPAEARAPALRTLDEHWRALDRYFDDCGGGQPGPCFNWLSPRRGRAPRRADALRCGDERRPASRRRAAQPAASPGLAESLDAPRGFLSALLLCAMRVAGSLSASHAGALAAAAPPRGGERRPWGLLVLSDSPALPSLAANLPALRGRVVSTAGAGQLGHSSFARSCSSRGCSRGKDPGGAWTRSLVDFYLAGAADGFVKGLFTSFLYSTMRRNLLCCEPGAFVQWMAWYNLSRSHRDVPMTDRGFMAALGTAWGGEGEGGGPAAPAAHQDLKS